MYFLGTVVLAVAAMIGQCFTYEISSYGPSYQGQQMGCSGSGLYDTNNPHIIAVGYDSPWQCGDKLRVTGPAGYTDGWVVDTCPGCTGMYRVDMSEAGQLAVCGYIGLCDATILEIE